MAIFELATELFNADWKASILTVLVTYYLGLIVYRLTLHPLANVPGPKLAAITSWWELYYQIVKQGQLEPLLYELHKEYGPIIRISPRGLHLSDPEVYERIYHVGSRFDKDPVFYNEAWGPPTFFRVSDNTEHRKLREPLNPFFSRRNVLSSMQGLIQDEVERFNGQLAKLEAAAQPAVIHYAFRCITNDVMSRACWGSDEKLILQDGFSKKKIELLNGLLNNIWVRLYFRWLTKLSDLVPPRWVASVDEGFAYFFEMINAAMVKAEILTRTRADDAPPTVFHALLDEEARREAGRRELDVSTAAAVGLLLVGAAIETTANALTFITYNVLKNEEIYKRLQEELDIAFPDPNTTMSQQELERLPYLTAIIQEGIRVSLGVSSRLPRLIPPGGMVYGKYHLPAGYQIGMGAYSMHTNETIFPEPFSFKPERWLNNKGLEKYLVSFTKGSRQCLGMNLAYCEMYLTVGMLFRRWDMQLHDIGDEDVTIVHDYFTASTKLSGRKLTVIHKSRA